MNKRLFAALVCAMLLMTLLPGPALAKPADKSALQLDVSGISAGDRVYFGEYSEGGTDYDVPWLVIGSNGEVKTGLDKTPTGLFLLSEYLLGRSEFRTADDSGYYPGSTLNAEMADYYNGANALFTEAERNAVADTTLDKSSMNVVVPDDLTGQKLFPLNQSEADDIAAQMLAAKDISTELAGHWWLRSSTLGTSAHCVDERGTIDSKGTVDPNGVRPAFNLDVSKVLFASAADNSGKSDSFAAPAAYSGSEWKLTLKDSNDFSIGTSLKSRNAELKVGYSTNSMTFGHSALSSFSAGYTDVTAALVNAEGELLYYGSVNKNQDALFSTVNIPEGLQAGKYTLSLYCEDRNEGNETDYATGTPFTQEITVAESKVWIFGQELTSETPYYHNGTNGTQGTVNNDASNYNAYFDASAAKLYIKKLNVTLSDAEAPSSYMIRGSRYAICIIGNATIDLSGNSVISTADSADIEYSIALAADENLRLTGNGTLTAHAGTARASSFGVAGGAIAMTGGTLAAGGGMSANSSGVYGGIVDISGGTLTAIGGEASGEEGMSFGIFSQNGSIAISGGTVTAVGGAVNDDKDSLSAGIFSPSVTISGGTTLAKGNTFALPSEAVELSGYTAAHAITVSADISGLPTEEYDADNIDTYKYFRIGPPPTQYDHTSAQVTVYNDPVHTNATIWLAGSGLSTDDMLITERDPSGSAYKAMEKLAGSSSIFNTYNIYLKSGRKSTGNAMDMTFDLNAKYAGQDFTLVHQRADSTYEYFYDTADANGDLTFGPLYELSPFILVKGTLTAESTAVIPQTGDSSQPALWLGAALLIAAASLAGATLCRRKRG